MSISGTEWLIIVAVIVLLFGRGQVRQLMGNAARGGIKSFRRGLRETGEPTDTAGTGPPVAGG